MRNGSLLVGLWSASRKPRLPHAKSHATGSGLPSVAGPGTARMGKFASVLSDRGQWKEAEKLQAQVMAAA
jgi:hypothetical protein